MRLKASHLGYEEERQPAHDQSMVESPARCSTIDDDQVSFPQHPPLPSNEPPHVADPEADTGYYDFLVLGRAGMGKSSTVDKLMVLNTKLSILEHSASGPGNRDRCTAQTFKMANHTRIVDDHKNNP